MSVSEHDFNYVSALVAQLSAIVLEPGKEYLVETRLEPLVYKEGYDTISDLIEKLKAPGCPASLMDKVVDALTTNETSFFRDIHPFETLKTEIIPELIKRNEATRKIQIWNAACSTGQEPYTLAMMIRENFPQLNDWNIEILATDISSEVLAKAQKGSFSQLEVNRGLPAIYLLKYFSKGPNETWQIKDEVKDMIVFKKLNLIEAWGIMPLYDIIMLRNVMIYFDNEKKKQILDNMCRCLHPEGYLFLGTAETTLNLNNTLRSATYGNGKTIIFRKMLAAQAAS
ncbi:MAG: protein-glutamate O-methyltransferase CheR [Verrucomicrobiota bacterium]